MGERMLVRVLVEEASMPVAVGVDKVHAGE